MRRSWGLRRAAACPLVVVTALWGLTACSSAPKSAHRNETVVRVTERDFQISVSPSTVPAGSVKLAVHNRGPEHHEMIVVRMNGSSIPLDRDGITVDEGALKKVTAGGLEPGAAGSIRDLTLKLSPGRYEVFCNMSGHYLGGMHTELTVS